MSDYLLPRRFRRRFHLLMDEGDLLTESEIVEASVEHQPVCGVYFLVQNDKVQYVGQARDVDRRLSQHWADGKRWDRVTVIECMEKHLDVIESAYIHKLRPPAQGRRGHTGELVAPLREAHVYYAER